MFVVFVVVCSYVSDICLKNLVTRAGQFRLFDLPCSIHQIHHHPIIHCCFLALTFRRFEANDTFHLTKEISTTGD